MKKFLFTSEAVTEGHPDKLCDLISDAVLDASLAVDPFAKVACETATKNNLVVLLGEITCSQPLDFEKIVRSTLEEVGYDDPKRSIDHRTCKVQLELFQQSPDIAEGVHRRRALEKLGAGDQGLMFGYATAETPKLMPLSHVLATDLCKQMAKVRKEETCPWIRPDAKAQVTLEYAEEGGALTPLRIHTVLVSTQHSEEVSNEQIDADLREYVLSEVLPSTLLDKDTIFHLNPSGRFVLGGPTGDAGVTGRKIIVDTYGGWGAHGGGAFSGKDPSKVDRTGAYAARWIAKSIVASDLAKRVLVQLSYAIGIAEPLSINLNTYGTGTKTEAEILELVKANFDLRPGVLIKDLDLLVPKYKKTAAYGHFGRSDPDFTWEVPKILN